MSLYLIYDRSTLNIASGYGLVPSGNKPLPEPMLSQIYVAIWQASQGHNGLNLHLNWNLTSEHKWCWDTCHISGFLQNIKLKFNGFKIHDTTSDHLTNKWFDMLQNHYSKLKVIGYGFVDTQTLAPMTNDRDSFGEQDMLTGLAAIESGDYA